MLNKDGLQHIINYFGYDNQRQKLNEEHLELQIELAKKEPEYRLVLEEMADLLVLVEQFKMIYEIEQEELIKEMNRKIKRTIYRIELQYEK